MALIKRKARMLRQELSLRRSSDITTRTFANSQCTRRQEPVAGWINGAVPPQANR